MKNICISLKRCLAVLFLLAALPMSRGAAQIINTIAGNGSAGFGGDGGPATAATLNAPTFVALDASGNIFIADQLGNKVRRIDHSTGVITTVVSNGSLSAGYSGDGGPATAAQLDWPNCLAFDRHGNMFISDHHNNAIRKVTTAGVISTVAGTGSSGYSGDGGPATAARLVMPCGVWLDKYDNIYIGDQNRVRKVDTFGVITTYAGNGTTGFSGDGGPATAAKLYYPTRCIMDTIGNLFIADGYNNRIRKVTPSGIISTYAGNGSASFGGDGGQATAASMIRPNGVFMDGSGNLYICDWYNYRIRKVAPSGIITTVTGTSSAGFSGDGGAATAAQVNDAIGVFVDPGGIIYIADASNNRIRKIGCVAPSAGAITGADSICVGTSGTLTASTSGGSWSSSNPSILSVSASSGVITGVSSGLDTISYCISSSCGSSCVTRTLTVVSPLDAGHILGADTACLGGTFTLIASSSGGSWVTLTPAIATVSAGGTVTALSTGTAVIGYIATNMCGSDTARKPIMVTSVPSAGTITGVDSICVGTITNFTSSVSAGIWNSSSSAIATVSSSGTVTGVSSGSVTIWYIMNNVCGADTATSNLMVVSGNGCPSAVSSLQSSVGGLSVYPNPNSGAFTVSVTSLLNERPKVVVTNIFGQKVMEFEALPNGQTQVDLKVPAGNYFVATIVDGQKVVKRVVVE